MVGRKYIFGTDKGFTLIEILVVISIISLLTALILIPLTETRIKAKDGRIVLSMAQIRPVAALYFSDHNNTYAGLESNPNITILLNDVGANGGEKPSDGSVGADIFIDGVENNKYCIEVKMNNATFWCVDYTGVSKKYNEDPGCGAAYFSCD